MAGRLDEGELCVVCGYGRFVETPHVSLREPGPPVEGLLHMVCSHCKEWVVTPEQSRHNKRLLIAARRGWEYQYPQEEDDA